MLENAESAQLSQAVKVFMFAALLVDDKLIGRVNKRVVR